MHVPQDFKRRCIIVIIFMSVIKDRTNYEFLFSEWRNMGVFFLVRQANTGLN